LPGYSVHYYVDGFVETAAGFVPRLRTTLNFRDWLGTIRARIGVFRNQYKVNPGLYCVGNPSDTSPVLVTANYKLSFDSLRKELVNLDGWLLVVDTRGINVWCSAGKKTFSAEEVALQVKRAKLKKIVSHRELILPQLSAPGVVAHQLKKKCGFKGRFGPVRAADLPEFLKNSKQDIEFLRKVTFNFRDRAVLIPVEIVVGWKIIFMVLMGIFIVSGVGKDVFSLQASWQRGLFGGSATIAGILSGAAIVPLMLPLIPGRQFWLKGAWIGILTAMTTIFMMSGYLTLFEEISLFIWVIAISSYTAMNFTGATPFTSLSGVESEMQNGLLVQVGGSLSAIILWIIAPFLY